MGSVEAVEGKAATSSSQLLPLLPPVCPSLSTRILSPGLR